MSIPIKEIWTCFTMALFTTYMNLLISLCTHWIQLYSYYLRTETFPLGGKKEIVKSENWWSPKGPGCSESQKTPKPLCVFVWVVPVSKRRMLISGWVESSKDTFLRSSHLYQSELLVMWYSFLWVTYTSESNAHKLILWCISSHPIYLKSVHTHFTHQLYFHNKCMSNHHIYIKSVYTHFTHHLCFNNVEKYQQIKVSGAELV